MIQVFKIGLFKTLWFNFSKLPFHQAVHLPIILARNTTVICCKRGSFEFRDMRGGMRTGCVLIGFNRTNINGNPSSLKIEGKIIVRGIGVHCFGAGCHLSVGMNAILDIGDGFVCTGDTTIGIIKSLFIGRDNLGSYNCVVLDNDGHQIFDDHGNIINPPKDVVFGEHVWMGNGCLILKGTQIPSGCVIASGSRINKVVTETDSIITTDGRILKHNIGWKP